MTLKHWLITGALALAAFPAGAELYRWVDASGTVHYSDTPQQGAEKVELKPTNVIPSRAPVQTRSNGPTPDLNESQELGEPDALVPYTAASIRSPQKDETLWNVGGTLTVQVQILPKLQKGHGLVLFYDGRQVNPNPVASTSMTIDNVFRGQHSVRAAIQDSEGNTMFNGEPVTFFIQQSTVSN